MKTLKKIAAVATTAALFVPVVALADMNSSSISISTTNAGSISNSTTASASTGFNFAGGSSGGDGGSGGEGGDVEVEGGGDFNNGGATAGDGGDGGNGGNGDAGGLIDTGDANADAGTLNSLNTTDVDVDLGGEDMNSSSLTVDVDNSEDCECNHIDNYTRAKARTGFNFAGGSYGGNGDNGGEGGEVEVDGDGNNNNGGAEAGNGGEGGDGGDGGLGGEVHTGVATSNAGTVNVLNTTLVRVRL